MNNLFSVKDQVVVITGGTGVLGKAIAAQKWAMPLWKISKQKVGKPCSW